jgi:hypothetical protein
MPLHPGSADHRLAAPSGALYTLPPAQRKPVRATVLEESPVSGDSAEIAAEPVEKARPSCDEWQWTTTGESRLPQDTWELGRAPWVSCIRKDPIIQRFVDQTMRLTN